MKNVTPKAGQTWINNSTGATYQVDEADFDYIDLDSLRKHFTFQPQKDTKMTTNGEKFNAICEFFPVTAREMAESTGVNLGELRALIARGDHYIDDSCRLRTNSTVKAFNNLADAVNKLNEKESQKEAKMIDLSDAKVGDKFNTDGDFPVQLVHKSNDNTRFCLEHDGSLFILLRDGSSKHLNITQKHDSRHWLKDLPDADIFNDGWLAYNNGVSGWYFFESEPNDKIQAGESMCSVRCLDMIKMMPKLTGDEWKLSKISIPDLKAWQAANNGSK